MPEEFTPDPDVRFNGSDYVHERDQPRLLPAMEKVKAIMLDRERHTIYEISERTAIPHQSVSAYLRHLRKRRFGSYIIMKKHIGAGVFEYWMPPRRRLVRRRETNG